MGFFQPGSARQHNIVAVLVEFDDLGFEMLPHIGLQVSDPTQLHERGGQESAQTDVHDQSALDDFDHQTLDHSAGFFDAFDLAPSPFILGTFLGQEQTSVFVFFGEDEGFDGFTHGDDLVGIDIVADRQLTAGDHAFRLVADVEQDFVLVDSYDRTFNELAVFNNNHGGGVCVLDIHPPEVCVNDLAGGVITIGIERSESRLSLDSCVVLHSSFRRIELAPRYRTVEPCRLDSLRTIPRRNPYRTFANPVANQPVVIKRVASQPVFINPLRQPRLKPPADRSQGEPGVRRHLA